LGDQDNRFDDTLSMTTLDKTEIAAAQLLINGGLSSLTPALWIDTIAHL
jgi:hypothetical protein